MRFRDGVMRFEVGDRVRVRQWDDMADEYGVKSLIASTDIGYYIIPSHYAHCDCPNFTTPMKELCGLSGTVERVGLDAYGDCVDSIRVKFDLDDGKSNIDFRWNYSSTMFEPDAVIEIDDTISRFIDNM